MLILDLTLDTDDYARVPLPTTEEQEGVVGPIQPSEAAGAADDNESVEDLGPVNDDQDQEERDRGAESLVEVTNQVAALIDGLSNEELLSWLTPEESD